MQEIVTMANRQTLEQRVIRAADAALAARQYASPIDMLLGIGFLAPSHIKDWRTGRMDYLEMAVQANLSKISFCMAAFRRWAVAAGLTPSEPLYARKTHTGVQNLQFSKYGKPSVEKYYRAHFVSPKLSKRMQDSLRERLGRPPQTVVICPLRDAVCSGCDAEIPRHGFLLMEDHQPRCLACARMDDLEYLPAGDALLTRRATKYSGRMAVVVRFSRARKRYERQGTLVERAALEKAARESTRTARERESR